MTTFNLIKFPSAREPPMAKLILTRRRITWYLLVWVHRSNHKSTVHFPGLRKETCVSFQCGFRDLTFLVFSTHYYKDVWLQKSGTYREHISPVYLSAQSRYWLMLIPHTMTFIATSLSSQLIPIYHRETNKRVYLQYVSCYMYTDWLCLFCCA